MDYNCLKLLLLLFPLDDSMLRIHFSQLLLLLWKLSTVYILPIIIFLYIDLLNAYSEGFSFQQLDQGQNIHKWFIFAIYLAYLLIWKGCNHHVASYLKKLEY